MININDNDFSNEEFKENNGLVNLNEEQLNINKVFIRSMMDQMTMLEQHNKYITEVHKDMKKLRQEVGEAKDIAVNAADKAEKVLFEINNHVYLSDAEASAIHDIIREKSSHIAFDLDDSYFPGEKDFGRVVGKVRKGLWSMLRKKFGVSSYKKIKHKDFKKAQEVSNSYTIEKYINYLNAKNTYIK